jgi:hypothetical protein
MRPQSLCSVLCRISQAAETFCAIASSVSATPGHAAGRVIAFRPGLAHDHGIWRRRCFGLRRGFAGGWIGALTRVRGLVLAVLGELLEVEQLPPGHDQVAGA